MEQKHSSIIYMDDESIFKGIEKILDDQDRSIEKDRGHLQQSLKICYINAGLFDFADKDIMDDQASILLTIVRKNHVNRDKLQKNLVAYVNELKEVRQYRSSLKQDTNNSDVTASGSSSLYECSSHNSKKGKKKPRCTFLLQDQDEIEKFEEHLKIKSKSRKLEKLFSLKASKRRNNERENVKFEQEKLNSDLLKESKARSNSVIEQKKNQNIKRNDRKSKTNISNYINIGKVDKKSSESEHSDSDNNAFDVSDLALHQFSGKLNQNQYFNKRIMEDTNPSNIIGYKTTIMGEEELLDTKCVSIEGNQTKDKESYVDKDIKEEEEFDFLNKDLYFANNNSQLDKLKENQEQIQEQTIPVTNFNNTSIRKRNLKQVAQDEISFPILNKNQTNKISDEKYLRKTSNIVDNKNKIMLKGDNIIGIEYNLKELNRNPVDVSLKHINSYNNKYKKSQSQYLDLKIDENEKLLEELIQPKNKDNLYIEKFSTFSISNSCAYSQYSNNITEPNSPLNKFLKYINQQKNNSLDENQDFSNQKM